MLELVYPLSIGVLSFLGGMAGGYCRGYIAKKGENKAMNEDLSGLTRLVENVKREFTEAADAAAHERSKILERLKGAESLRMLAGSDRLRAHQEAFTHWQAMITSPPLDQEAMLAAHQWWCSNCLYLDEKARMAFSQAVAGFSTRRGLLLLQDPSSSAAQSIGVAETMLRNAGSTIMVSVGLPPLHAVETDILKEGSADPHAKATVALKKI